MTRSSRSTLPTSEKPSTTENIPQNMTGDEHRAPPHLFTDNRNFKNSTKNGIARSTPAKRGCDEVVDATQRHNPLNMCNDHL